MIKRKINLFRLEDTGGLELILNFNNGQFI